MSDQAEKINYARVLEILLILRDDYGKPWLSSEENIRAIGNFVAKGDTLPWFMVHAKNLIYAIADAQWDGAPIYPELPVQYRERLAKAGEQAAYVIHSQSETEQQGESMFWSKRDGWVSKANATVFAEKEQLSLSPPIPDGKWVKL